MGQVYGQSVNSQSVEQKIDLPASPPIAQLFQSLLHASEVAERLHHVATAIVGRLDGELAQVASGAESKPPIGALREASNLVDSLMYLEDRLAGIANRLG